MASRRAHRAPFLLAGGLLVFACSGKYGETIQDEGSTIPTAPFDAGVDVAHEEPEDAASPPPPLPEPRDAAPEDAAPDAPVTEDDASPPLPCAGKPDGYAYVPGSTLDRCCGGKPARMDDEKSCGACGIACAAGQDCKKVDGKPTCECPGSNASCVAAGYGDKATCYSSNGSYCNCVCPAGQSTCLGQCPGNAVCHTRVGHNYCESP